MDFKGCDYSLALNPITNTNSSAAGGVCLNLIRQGVNSWERVGREIMLRFVRLVGLLEFVITPAATTGNTSGNAVRMVVVYDTRPSTPGSLPLFSDMFAYTDQAGGEFNSFQAPLRYDNMGRFTLLDDVTFHGNPPALPATGNQNAVRVVVPFDRYVTLGNRLTTYGASSTPAGIGDISTGALYVYFMSLGNTASDFAIVGGTSVARLRYSDQ